MDEILLLLQACKELGIAEIQAGDVKAYFRRKDEDLYIGQTLVPMMKYPSAQPEAPQQASAPSRIEVAVSGEQNAPRLDSLLELALKPERDLIIPTDNDEKA